MRVVDRALCIGKHVITDASVNCWANPVRTCCPTDRNATAVHSSVLIPVLKWNCCCRLWGHIYASSISTRVVDTRTESSWQSITNLVMWRRNIHSLLTLAAEPSEPNVGAAAQPLSWSISQGQVAGLWDLNSKESPGYTHCTNRKERAAGVVPAFTL